MEPTICKYCNAKIYCSEPMEVCTLCDELRRDIGFTPDIAQRMIDEIKAEEGGK